MAKLLIVDRDGVLNHESPDFIKSPDEWVPLPGSMQAIAIANSLGYRTVVMSNQSGLARGLFDIEQLNRIHSRMCSEAARFGGQFDGIFFCPHLPDAGCECRKPKPGMLVDIGQRLRTNLTKAIVVGDRESDMQAAAAVGARRFLVRTGHGEQVDAENAPPDVTVCNDLAEVVNRLRVEAR